MNIILSGGPADGHHMTLTNDQAQFVEVPVDEGADAIHPAIGMYRRIFASARYERTGQTRDGMRVYEYKEK